MISTFLDELLLKSHPCTLTIEYSNVIDEGALIFYCPKDESRHVRSVSLLTPTIILFFLLKMEVRG